MTQSGKLIKHCPLETAVKVPAFPLCANRSCGFNYSDKGASTCVLMALSGLDTITQRIDLLEGHGLSTPAVLAKHLEELRKAADDFAALSAVPNPSDSCQNCGYPTKCASQTLCDERRTALDSLNSVLDKTITRYQVWEAVQRDRARFLTDAFVTRTLEPLLSKPNRRKDPA